MIKISQEIFQKFSRAYAKHTRFFSGAVPDFLLTLSKCTCIKTFCGSISDIGEQYRKQWKSDRTQARGPKWPNEFPLFDLLHKTFSQILGQQYFTYLIITGRGWHAYRAPRLEIRNTKEKIFQKGKWFLNAQCIYTW